VEVTDSNDGVVGFEDIDGEVAVNTNFEPK